MTRLHPLVRGAVFASALVLSCGVNTAMAQDLATLLPDSVKILIDNDRVRVLEIRHKPGAKEPMHSHPAYVVVFLSGTRLKATTPDGKTREGDRKAGEVLWSEATTHALENVGTTDQHVIVIELKK